jgi:Bacterial Ig-like domain (group 1).
VTHFTDGARAPSHLPGHLARPVRTPIAEHSLTVRHSLRLVPVVALLISCGGADLVLPGDGEPAAITVVQGDGQTGRVGVALATPVVARVTDSQGRPVSGARVAMVFTGDPSGATVAPDTATTDGDGRALFQVVLGSRIGQSTAEVRVPTAGGQRTLTAPVGFDAVSDDGQPARGGCGRQPIGRGGGHASSPLVVQVTDAFGNPIAGVQITWSADAGSVSDQTTSTGSDGLTSVVRTLGTGAGVQHASASAAGLAGSPVTFTQIVSAGAAATLEPVSGDGQAALVGTSVADPLVVRARDAQGNPVAGIAVAWVIGSGGGSLSPQTSLTDDQGLASTRWTLGSGPGSNTATAVISGVGTVEFSATGQPGTPPSLSLETQPPASAIRGVAWSRAPVIQLREAGGQARRRSGVAVNVSLAAGGGTLNGTLTRVTGADGRVEFRDLALAGPPGTYTFAFTATGYAGVTSAPMCCRALPRRSPSSRMLPTLP